MSMTSLFDVSGKVAVVTGGSSGIGSMMARGLLENGAKVYITARKAERLEAMQQELSQYGEMIVDEHGATNLPGIYAAGDATTVPDKQIVVAMGNGETAGLGAFDYLIRNEPVEDVEAGRYTIEDVLGLG